MKAITVARILGMMPYYQEAVKKIGESHTCNQGCGEGWCARNEDGHQMEIVIEMGKIKYEEAAEKQEPFRWALDHFALGLGTTLFDSEQEAIDFSRNLAGSSKAIPLYATPVPADKPLRITEQDVREIADNVMEFNYDHKHSVDYWMREEGYYLLNKLNADRKDEPSVSVPDGWKLVPIEPTEVK